MMQGHEVGHALYTDEAKWIAALTEEGVHKQILNVVEDARIEKRSNASIQGSLNTLYLDIRLFIKMVALVSKLLILVTCIWLIESIYTIS